MTKNVYLASILNFFLLGPGYIYHGKKMLKGVLLTIGAVLATYVELQLQDQNSELYPIMFAAIFLIAIATTFDIYTEIKNES